MTKRQSKFQQRYAFIASKVLNARHVIRRDLKYDWQKESDEINDAAEALVLAELDYADEKVTEDQVKRIYKTYVDLFEIPLETAEPGATQQPGGDT